MSKQGFKWYGLHYFSYLLDVHDVSSLLYKKKKKKHSRYTDSWSLRTGLRHASIFQQDRSDKRTQVSQDQAQYGWALKMEDQKTQILNIV